jgi:hypothetical protein
MAFHLLKTYPSLFFISFFTLPPCLVRGRNADANPDIPDRCAYISASGGEFCQVSIFAKLVCQTVGGRIFLVLPKLDGCQASLPGDAQLQEFAKFYLANLVFCQLVRRYTK